MNKKYYKATFKNIENEYSCTFIAEDFSEAIKIALNWSQPESIYPFKLINLELKNPQNESKN